MSDEKKSEKKNTSKLYRYIQQLAHRLDLQLQNASDWKEFFDSETLLLRQKFKDACEQALCTTPPEVSRRVEDILWRKGFYDVIQKLRADKKKLQNDRVLCTLYHTHLNAAHSFYHHLLIQLKEKFPSSITSAIDWYPYSQSFESQQGHVSMQNNAEKETYDWAVKACQRCLLYLGDLARYCLDVEKDMAMKLAERLYHQAILVFPLNGMPHNQLGTLKQQAGYPDCEVAYHYLRCLHSSITFDGAEENLKRTFDRNRWTQKANSDSSCKSVECFLLDFLDLQRLFLYARLQPKDYNNPCQSVVEKFIEILKLPEWGKILGRSQDKNSPSETKPVKEDLAVVKLSGSLMIKIFTICILVVEELRKKESNVLSAAVAFTFTLLSKLLDYIARMLPESPLVKMVQSSAASAENASNGKSVLKKTEESLRIKREKVRQMKRNRRRRRRKDRLSEESSENESLDDSDDYRDQGLSSESASDLSEGELSSSSCGDLHSFSDSEADEDTSCNPALPLHQKARQSKNFKAVNTAGGLLTEICKQISGSSEVSSSHPERFMSHRWGYVDDLTRSSFEESVSLVTEYCYLPTLKAVSDWLRHSNFILLKYAKDVPWMWEKFTSILRKLPLSEILPPALQCGHRRKNTWLIAEITDTSHQQSKALPEDISLIGLPVFHALHQSLNFHWGDHTKDNSVLQFIVRVKALKAFGIFLTEKLPELPLESEGVSSCEPDAKEMLRNQTCDVIHASEPESQVTGQNQISQNGPPNDGFGSRKNDNDKNQAKLMKAFAKQKLMHDVSKLQDMNKPNETPDMSPFLILDCQALCRHLSLIRSLVKSREFILIIPVQVVQALDELKKYNPSAREAIKFLEEEFRHRSRWLRSQKDHESLDYDVGHVGKKKKNFSLEEWRFLQVVKCASYFASKHAGDGMVSVLTAKMSKESSSSLGTRSTPVAVAICEKMGVQIQSLVEFYQKWTAKRNL